MSSDAHSKSEPARFGKPVGPLAVGSAAPEASRLATMSVAGSVSSELPGSIPVSSKGSNDVVAAGSLLGSIGSLDAARSGSSTGAGAGSASAGSLVGTIAPEAGSVVGVTGARSRGARATSFFGSLPGTKRE